MREVARPLGERRDPDLHLANGDGAGGGTVTQFEPMRQAGGGSTWLCACCLTWRVGKGGGKGRLKGAAYPNDCLGNRKPKPE